MKAAGACPPPSRSRTGPASPGVRSARRKQWSFPDNADRFCGGTSHPDPPL